MGFFSSSYKNYQSISFQPLKSEPYGELAYAKKQIVFALAGNLGRYGNEIAKYKRDYRSTFSDSFVSKLGIEPEVKTVKNIDYSDIRQYIIDSGVANLESIIDLEDKNNSLGDNPPKEDVLDYFMSSSSMPYLLNSDGYDYYCNVNSTAKENGVIRWKINNISFLDSNNDIELDYTEYEYVLNDQGTPEPEDDTIDEVLNGPGSQAYDCAEFFYAKAYYFTTDDTEDTTRFALVPYEYFTDSMSTDSNIADIELAPIMKIESKKQILSSCYDEEEGTFDVGSCTLEERTKWRNQQRALKRYGVSLDSVQSMLDNEEIDDFRIGLAISPEDAARSIAVSKYMFSFFDSIGGEENAPIHTGIERNRTIPFEINGLEVRTRFNLEEKTYTGTIPKPEDCKEYKIKLTQAVTNSDRYYDDIKDIYDSYIGGGLTDIRDMYNAVVNWWKEDKNDEDRDSAYNKLPPSDYYKNTFGHKYTYAFCTPDEFEDILHDEIHINIADEGDTPDWVRLYNIVSYKEHRVLPTVESDKYYTVMSKYETNYKDGIVVHRNDVIKIELYKQVSSNQYKKFTYSSGKLEYEIDGHSASVYHSEADGTFRFFLTKDAVKGLRFKEYVAVFDRSLCGLAYCHTRVKVKWYQKAGFKLFLQVVMIVASIAIAVFTGGAGSSVSAAIVQVAVNMAVAYAITYIAMEISEAIGGDIGVAIAAIAAVAAFYFTGSFDTNSTAQLWLTASDVYFKLKTNQVQEETKRLQEDYDRFKREMRVKTRMLQESIELMSNNGYTREAILANIANQAYNDGFTNTMLTDEIAKSIEEDEWKLPEVKPVDYDLAETLYNSTTEIPDTVYNFNGKMREIEVFGSSQNQ